MTDSQGNDQNMFLDTLLSDFLDESDQHLTLLNERLLQLDEWVRALDKDHQQPCDPDLLNEMFRAAHSIKGLSAMLGLTDINNLTHKIENVFDAARKNELVVNGDVTQLVFMGLDQLTALIELLKDPDAEPVDSAAVVNAIGQLLQSAGVEKKQSSQADAEKAMQIEPVEKNCNTLEWEPDVPLPSEGTEVSDQSDPLGEVRDEDEIPENYLAIFIDESEIALDTLTANLLALEGGGSNHDLKELMGIAHKVKGSAAAIGLNRLAKLSHLMEDVLQELVESHGSLSTVVTDVLLKFTDAMQRYVAELKHGNAQSEHFTQLARDLLAARKEPEKTGVKASVEEVEEAASTAFATTYAIEVQLDPTLPAASLKADLICEKLGRLGEVSDCIPLPETFCEIEHLTSLQLHLTTESPIEAIRDQLHISGLLNVRITPFIQPAEKVETPPVTVQVAPAAAEKPQPAKLPEKPQGTDSAQRPTETIRVDIDRLDHLMDLAGQLVINKAQFSQIGDKFKRLLGSKQSIHTVNRVSAQLGRIASQFASHPEGEQSSTTWENMGSHVRRVQKELELLRRDAQILNQVHDCVSDLFEAIHQLGRVSDGIQQSVMDTRMVPIGPLFSRFKRVVRDITRSSNKQARLEIHGENTELDKRMIDELGDPLVHMVRNSVDHGIEPPDVREAAGKPREGTVTLDAFHRGNSIVIEVRDDGKGLDADRILKKCLEKGLVTPADAERLTPQQIYQKIWEPGLSTAEKITEVSGRGMGMDIVKSKIEELSGTVDIDSVPGQGTTISVKLPLTLAILPSLMVEIRGDVFAIPMEAVKEIVNIGRNQINSVHGRRMAMVRDRVIALLRLGDLLTFHNASENAIDPTSEVTLVIVGEGNEQVGLVVDGVIGEEDVVIKSIADNFANVLGISGASILGDGRVSLILDIASLLEAVSKKSGE